jgi:uncharacterized membrane protein YbhN (UPF0104 family)
MKGVDALGWVATVLFLTSYTCRDQRALRRTQAAAAGVWALYGVLLHALPIIVANLLVAAVAVYSSRPRRAADPSLDGGPRTRITTSAEPDLSRIS